MPATKNMYEVHKDMALDVLQIGYFITQIGLSAASFGVAQVDMVAVDVSLNCAPPATVALSQGLQLQAVCIEVR
jgi:hypothetical protein